MFIVDAVTISTPEHPLLVVQAIEHNLSIANLDLFELAGSVGADGVFRGF